MEMPETRSGGPETQREGPGTQQSGPETQAASPPLRLPFTEKYGISPVLFGSLSLVAVFVTYQMIGGMASYLIFGSSVPGAAQVSGYRLATALGELLLVLGPALILVRFATLSPRSFLRLSLPDARTLLVPLIGVLSLQEMLQIYLVFQEKIPLPDELQTIVTQFRELFEQLYRLLVTSSSVPELVSVIIVIALIPALAEEFLFRGLIQRSFEKSLGPVRAFVLTGIIFGAYHLDPFSFVPLAVLGIYLGFVAYRANSLWSSIAAHFFNNALVCVASYFHMDKDSVIVGDPAKLSGGALLAIFWFSGVVFLVATLYFIRITGSRPDKTGFGASS